MSTPILFRFASARSGARVGLPTGPDWVRLGDDFLFIGTESALTADSGAGRVVSRHPHSVKREDLCLVTQIGNVFERSHPDVPIVANKGRYLVVDLEPAKATQLARTAHDYAIRPLAGGSVVFDTRSREEARRSPQPRMAAFVDRLAEAEVEGVLGHLVSFPTRFSTSTSYAGAAEFARSRLASLGYETRTEDVTVGNRRSLNVVADLAAATPGPRQMLLVVAHLDSVNLAGGPSAEAPGADDNASGSAGLLEMARVLRQHGGRHDLRFVLFGGEEQGLFGSRRHVASRAPAVAGRIRAVLNMDMVGTRNTPSATVLLEGAAASQSVIDALAEAAATYTSLEVQISLNPFNSDHVPFLDAGIPAVLTIEGADSSNSNVHTSGDTLDRVDRGLLLEILRMNVAFAAATLEVPEPPAAGPTP